MGFMFVFRAGIHMKIFHNVLTGRVFWEHAFYRKLQHFGRIIAHQTPHRNLPEVPEKTGMPIILLLFIFGARSSHFFGVNHHHMIPAHVVRDEGRPMPAAQNDGYPRAEPAKRLFGGINEIPILVCRLWKGCLQDL